MKRSAPSSRTKIKRMPKRASYEREVICSILDDSFICHAGFVINSQPYVIPLCYGREGDTIYFHGSVLSRMLRYISSGYDVCVEVSNVDAIVLARSAFHHSINYRSVVIFGKAKVVTDPAEKEHGLRVITEQIMPGRWKETRPPSAKELKQTAVWSLDIFEASAKIRNHGVMDDRKDMNLNVWAGIVPLKLCAGKPVKDPAQRTNIPLPGYIKKYKKNNAAFFTDCK